MRVFSIALACFLTACVAPQFEVKTPFDPALAGYIKEVGKGTLTGQAFLRRNDGVVVYAAGSEVLLYPVTPYHTEITRNIFGGGKVTSVVGPRASNVDPRGQEFRRTTKADGSGNFKFENLKAGSYYVLTDVLWNPTNNALPQGGGLYDRVEVRDGETTNVILSGT